MSIYINGFNRAKTMEYIRNNNLGYVCQNEKGDCLYKNLEDGNRCLVGCFIPTSEYKKEMENNDVIHLLSNFINLKKYMPIKKKYLSDLQNFHDTLNTSDYKNSSEFFNLVEKKLIQLEGNEK